MMPFVCDGLSTSKPHSWFAFCCSAKPQIQKQLEEERFYFILHLQVIVHL